MSRATPATGQQQKLKPIFESSLDLLTLLTLPTLLTINVLTIILWIILAIGVLKVPATARGTRILETMESEILESEILAPSELQPPLGWRLRARRRRPCSRGETLATAWSRSLRNPWMSLHVPRGP